MRAPGEGELASPSAQLQVYIWSWAAPAAVAPCGRHAVILECKFGKLSQGVALAGTVRVPLDKPGGWSMKETS